MSRATERGCRAGQTRVPDAERRRTCTASTRCCKTVGGAEARHAALVGRVLVAARVVPHPCAILLAATRRVAARIRPPHHTRSNWTAADGFMRIAMHVPVDGAVRCGVRLGADLSHDCARRRAQRLRSEVERAVEPRARRWPRACTSPSSLLPPGAGFRPRPHLLPRRRHCPLAHRRCEAQGACPTALHTRATPPCATSPRAIALQLSAPPASRRGRSGGD